MFSGKIFGIGFHKTGTSSLARALDILGYNVTASYGLTDNDIAETVVAKAQEIVPLYDAFQDNPWPIIYRELDQLYPGSKFILTMRPTDKWLSSVVKHFGGRNTAMRKWIYGVGDPRGNEEIYRARYERHNAEVLDYFSTRPNDFMVLQISGETSWHELCTFLEAPIPEVPFPHTNSAQERNKLVNRIKRGIKRVLN